MAKFVTWVLNMLETWFWCLALGFWAWEIHWDHFQTSQIDLRGHNGHLWPLKIWWNGQICNLGSDHDRDLMVLNMLETWFWCLSQGCWAWEIHWDNFQTPQIDQLAKMAFCHQSNRQNRLYCTRGLSSLSSSIGFSLFSIISRSMSMSTNSNYMFTG